MEPRYDALSAEPAASRSTGRVSALRSDLSGGAAARLSDMIAGIDWDDDPDALCRGDLASLPQDVVAAIERSARLSAVVALANNLGRTAVVVVICLMATAAASTSRAAQRAKAAWRSRSERRCSRTIGGGTLTAIFLRHVPKTLWRPHGAPQHFTR